MFGHFFFPLWFMNTWGFHHFFRSQLCPGLLRTLRALRTPQFAWQVEKAGCFRGLGPVVLAEDVLGFLWHFSGCVLYIKMGGGQEEEQAIACLSDS